MESATNHSRTKKIEISQKSIFQIFLAVVAFTLMYHLQDLLVGLFVSLLIATALNPIVSKLEKLKVPRPVAVLIIYLSVIASIILLVSTLVPPLIAQTNNLIESLPLEAFSGSFQSLEVSMENLQIITNQLGSVMPVLRVIGSTFSSLITLFTFAVITFYLMVERKNLHKYLMILFPNSNAEERAERFVDRIEEEIGGWVRGQIMLMFIVGLITYIGLVLLNVQYALPLAILAGMLELIPNVGPTVSAIPAIITPLLTGQNPVLSLFVLALYVIVQQLENNIIVPKVMQSAIGIHPLVTIVLIISGLKLAGVAGAILAVPVFLVLRVLYNEWYSPQVSSPKKTDAT